MSDPSVPEDLKIIRMIEDWTRQDVEMAEDHLQKVRRAIAEEDEAAADRLKIQHPPCPICGAEVTSYEVGPSEGPIVIEFQPCGNKVMRQRETDV